MKFKDSLKKIDLIREVYIYLHQIIVSIMVKFSPVVASKYIYMNALGKKLDLKNPKDFNEKLQWLKLYWQHPLVIKCADKYEVRSYVKECGCEDILNELYGVYNDVSEINWDLLPQKFALKTTNSCGTNIICNDKNKFSKEVVFKKIDKWMKADYGLVYAEIHYSKMTPRIICEKYIETESGFFPNDYKFFCFNGEPKFIYVGIDRETDFKRVFLDLCWNQMNLLKDDSNYPNKIKKPQNLNEMIACAAKLSKPFPFVRVDFYDFNGKTIFGEMTFTPSGCTANYFSEQALNMLGEWINLPSKY